MNRSVLIVHVDDESIMIRLINRVVSSFKRGDWEDVDFRIVSFQNSMQALLWIRAGNLPSVHLVISDYEMPEMDGIRLREALKKEFASLPAWIFISGASDCAELEAYTKQENLILLRKPFERADLRRVIADVVPSN